MSTEQERAEARERSRQQREEGAARRCMLPGPINNGAEVTMTAFGLKRMCAWHTRVRGGAAEGLKGKSVCDICTLRKAIQRGVKFSPPPGIALATLDSLKEARRDDLRSRCGGLAKQFARYRQTAANTHRV